MEALAPDFSSKTQRPWNLGQMICIRCRNWRPNFKKHGEMPDNWRKL